MSVLRGKKILLGVSGGIAAYKTANLVRLFIKAGAEVKVIMTSAAKDFVTPLTLSTLSKNPVHTAFYEEQEGEPVWNNHVDLGLWADIMLVAPATANTLAKMAAGTCDNLLIATYLSAKCQVFFAPAMDLDMYQHPSTVNSFQKLVAFGNIMIPAEKGELASGLHGEGRMAAPENIIGFLESYYEKNMPLRGKKLLITAGPTHEAIDPVRYIGNHASGKMGFELALKAAHFGATVYLVTGPTHCKADHPAITIIRVVSAQEMYRACHDYFDQVDWVIAAAAVADYRPAAVSREKIKKGECNLELKLEKTPDILSSLGAIKAHQVLVGFALETENELENAMLKIRKKNLDLVVLNSLRDAGAGFGFATNKVTLIDKQMNVTEMELKSKEEVAEDILFKVLAL